MLDQFFTYPVVLKRMHTGPLGSYIDSFATLLSERGYTRLTAMHQTRLVAELSRWLHRRGLNVRNLNEQIIVKFFRYLRRQRCIQGKDMPTLRLLLEHLRDSGVIPTPTPEVDDSELGRIERDFAQYLAHERRLSQATLINYIPVVRQFLSGRFGKGPVLLGELRTSDIINFVLQYTPKFSRGSAKVMVTALRSFFRFLRLRGDIANDLAAAVPAVANWRFATLPKWIPPEQVEHLLKSCDQSTTTGQRNYTILLLLARLGLRSSEVVAMTLDDIDWEAGEVRVTGKGRRQDRLPLPQDVGEALVKYLRHGRPRCSTRRVFVRMKAPIRGFLSSNAISTIVQRAFDHAGLHPPQKGSHILRHSLATNMLRKGASLREIGEILRHRDLSTTQIYAKVDLESLRRLAQPWPGGEA